MILLLLPILSLTAAKVFPRTGANEVLDGVSGVMYDIPDYEDPELVLFKLLARGIMPVFTQLSALKEITNEKDDKHYHETDDIKEELADVTTLLQTVKFKLEKGNNQVIKDIIQSIKYLESLKQRMNRDSDTLDTSPKKLFTHDTVVERSSTAATFAGEYSPLTISLRRQYLVSDDPIYKYFPLEPPVVESSNKDSSIQQQISPEASLILFVEPDVSDEEESSISDSGKESSVLDPSVEVVLSLQDASSSAPTQSLSSISSTPKSSEGELIFTYVSTPTPVIPADDIVNHDEPMKEHQESNVYISKTKQELGSKGSTIYKKMTWKSTNLL